MTLGIVAAFSAVGAVLALGPLFATTALGAGEPGWGILVTSFGLGMEIGMASSNKVVEFVEREYVFVWSIIAAAATLFVLAAMPGIGVASVVTVVLGGSCVSAWVSGYVLLQENVTDEFRGRTFASLTVLSRLGLFLSLTIFPVIAGAIGEHDVTVGDRTFDLSGTRGALMVAGLGAVLTGGDPPQAAAVPREQATAARLGTQAQAASDERAVRRVRGRGGDSGKGTQIRLAKEWLESQGIDVLVTREPGGARRRGAARDAPRS